MFDKAISRVKVCETAEVTRTAKSEGSAWNGQYMLLPERQVYHLSVPASI
jgi:hypothetical protein